MNMKIFDSKSAQSIPSREYDLLVVPEQVRKHSTLNSAW